MMRTWRARLVLVLLLTLIVATGVPANSQSVGPAQESFGLPVPSGQFQPVPPSPIHATTWSVRQVTQNGRKVALPNDAVVLFDWADVQTESLAYVYDGCEVSQTTFTWTARELFIAPRVALVETDRCTTNRQKAIHKFLTGTFLRQVGKVIRPGSTMTLIAGKRRIELVRRPENSLNQTAWVTKDSFLKPGVGQIDGRLSFGPTTFRASDGCNAIDGGYMYVGGQIVVLYGSQSAMACDGPRFGWPGGTSDAMLSTAQLTITTRSIVHRYRRITAVPIGGPPARPPDPNATAPFPSAAVFGSWNMESLSGGKTGPGAIGTIDFRADGSFLGETPCETVLGKWTQSAMSMATSIRSLFRLPKPCGDDLKPDALALGDLLSTSELAIGRGDVRLTLWKAGSGATNTGIQFIKA